MEPSADPQAPRRAVIVGAGPAGFYTADMLLKAGFEVDMLDLLPTPFGLVRFGVAPDHPNIKAVIRVYERIASMPGFRFFGGVELGRDVQRADLLRHYHAVVYAVGSSDDNRLGVPGEDRPGSHAATGFVAWYNGHPDGADLHFDLSCERAVVVGNGNVALDVARMLVLHPDELAPTDTADHAIEVLNRSAIREVVVLGRRGPVQAAFTNPELRELVDLQRAGVIVDATDLELDPHSAAVLEGEDSSLVRRNLETLHGYTGDPGAGTHRIVLRFLWSPVAILGEGDDGPVTGVRVVRNRLEGGSNGRLRAVATEREEVIECGLVLRSIGYRGRPVSDVPFDPARGLIRNAGGRVVDEDDRTKPGEYAVGWIKRGPSGVIGTNKKDAADTVARLLEDVEAGTLNHPAEPDPAAAAELYATRAPNAVTWAGWQAIDVAEKTAGAPQGRPRVKLVRLADMVAAAGAGAER